MCGCAVELAELIVDGRSLRTVAVEGIDAAHVFSTVQLLNFDVLTNVSFPRHLQTRPVNLS